MIYHYKKGNPYIVGGFGEGTKAEPWYWYGKTDGQTVDVNNSNADSSDKYRLYFRVILKSGVAYSFGQTAPGGGDGRIYLYDSNWTVLTSGDDTGGAYPDMCYYTPSADGIYYIGAGAYSGSTGDFTVFIGPLPEQEPLPEIKWLYPTSTGFNKAGKAVGYRSASLAGCRLSRWVDDNTVLYLPMYGEDPFVDQSANAYAFSNNGVTFVSDVKPPSGGSGAAHFTAANQYLLSTSNMLAGLTEFTLEFDYMLDSIPTGNNWNTAFYFASNGANSSAAGADMRLEKNYITVQMNHDNGLVKSDYIPDTGVWHTLRISRNADSVVSISIDNEPINSYTDTNALYSSQSYGYVIGRSEPRGEAGTGFRGYIANYRISNVARGVKAPPKITVDAIPDLIWEVGTAITDVQLSATVSDGGTPTFKSEDLPAGITLTTSGLLSGTPTADGAGSATITVSYPGAENAIIQLNYTIEAKAEEEEDLSGDYLTLTANTTGSTVSSKVTGTLELPGLKYRTDKNSGFVPYSVGQTIELANAGDYVQFYNTEETFSKSYNTYFTFKLTGSIAATGNIQSLLGFAESVPMAGYYQLFTGNSALTSAPEMPATSFGWASYGYMFYNCTNLSYIPCIPFDNWNADNSVTVDWVHGVAASGTIGYINSELPVEYGSSRIPEGWVEDNSYPRPGPDPDPDPDPVKKCPNRADCVKQICIECLETFCTTHQTPVICTDCELTFCSEECKTAHTCNPVESDNCSYEGCTAIGIVVRCEQCKQLVCAEHRKVCDICGLDFCLNHASFDKHSCIEAPIEVCSVDGCDNGAISQCTDCGNWVCSNSDHAITCNTCEYIYCPSCYADHRHEETTDMCDAADCNVAADTSCDYCGIKLCADHYEMHRVICDRCGVSYCPTRIHDGDCLMPSNCSADGCDNTSVTACKSCNRGICDGHAIICSSCRYAFCTAHATPCESCGLIYCVYCATGHNHDSGNKCQYGECTDEATSNCVTCGIALCGAHQLSCPNCQGGPYCPDHHHWAECPDSHSITGVCSVCNTKLCQDEECTEGHGLYYKCDYCGKDLCNGCYTYYRHESGGCVELSDCVKCGKPMLSEFACATCGTMCEECYNSHIHADCITHTCRDCGKLACEDDCCALHPYYEYCPDCDAYFCDPCAKIHSPCH